MDFIESIINSCERKNLCAEIKRKEELKNHTTIKTGGKAEYYITPNSLFSVKKVLSVCKEFDIPYKTIGNGSNLVFSDKGYNGAIISLKNLNEIYLDGEKVVAYAGAKLSELVKFYCNSGLSGAEEFINIPATVGGAIYQNAGAFNKSIKNVLISATCLIDGKIYYFDNKQCKFGYRKSIFKANGGIIIKGEFSYKKADKAQILKRQKEFIKKREISQPKGKTFGSVFSNPKGYSAGVLLEKAGLKNFRVGGAVFSNKHANFIINEDNAKSSDVVELIRIAKEKVKKEFGVELKEEVEFVGYKNDIDR